MLSIDFGSSRSKAIAWPVEGLGDPIFLADRDTPTPCDANPDGWGDDMATLIERLLDDIRDSLAGERLLIGAIAVTGQIGCVFPSSEDGRLLRPCLPWAHRPSEALVPSIQFELADQLPAALGHDLPAHGCWSLPKLRWWTRNHPDRLPHVRRWAQVADIVVHRLAGRWSSHPTTHLGLVHQRTGEPAHAMLRFAGIASEQLPTTCWPWTCAVRPEVAQWLGVPADTPIVSAGGDMFSGFVGFGLKPGDMAFQLGTTEIVGQCVPVEQGESVPQGLIRLPMSGDLDIVYGSTSDGGGSLAFLQRLLGRQVDGEELWQQAESLLPGADGLLFVPHVHGSRAPHWRSDDRGAFIGLHANHGPAHLLLAVLEGCAFSKRAVCEALIRSTRIEPTTLWLAGGGAARSLANRIRAAVLPFPVQVLEEREVTLRGAAAMALGGHGRAWLHKRHARHRPAILTPDPGWADIYESKFRMYRHREQQLMESP